MGAFFLGCLELIAIFAYKNMQPKWRFGYDNHRRLISDNRGGENKKDM